MTTGADPSTGGSEGLRPALDNPDLDEGALLARAAALGIALPPDRVPAIVDGARALHAAARLLARAVPAAAEPR